MNRWGMKNLITILPDTLGQLSPENAVRLDIEECRSSPLFFSRRMIGHQAISTIQFA